MSDNLKDRICVYCHSLTFEPVRCSNTNCERLFCSECAEKDFDSNDNQWTCPMRCGSKKYEKVEKEIMTAALLSTEVSVSDLPCSLTICDQCFLQTNMKDNHDCISALMELNQILEESNEKNENDNKELKEENKKLYDRNTTLSQHLRQCSECKEIVFINSDVDCANKC